MHRYLINHLFSLENFSHYFLKNWCFKNSDQFCSRIYHILDLSNCLLMVSFILPCTVFAVNKEVGLEQDFSSLALLACCCGVLSVYCKMSVSIPGFYPPYASSTSSDATTKDLSRLCQMLPRGMSPWLRITVWQASLHSG